MDTRQALIASATELVRTRGYNGFSYADLSESVGIRKASIHHHFPTKADIGAAIVERYTADFALELDRIRADQQSPRAQLRAYVGLYRASLTRRMGCLCGMLAQEVDVVPLPIAKGVGNFMQMNSRWLSALVEDGQLGSEITKDRSAQTIAAGLLCLCQGSLLVARASGDVAMFDAVMDSELQGLSAP